MHLHTDLYSGNAVQWQDVVTYVDPVWYEVLELHNR